MEETKTSDPSQTQLPYNNTNNISRLQVKQAETASTAKAARIGTSYLPRGNIADCKSKE